MTQRHKECVTGPCPECGRDVLLCWGDNDECTAEPEGESIDVTCRECGAGMQAAPTESAWVCSACAVGGAAELEATLAALPNVPLTEADYAEGERRALRWVR
jgi:hypothetical protein